MIRSRKLQEAISREFMKREEAYFNSLNNIRYMMVSSAGTAVGKTVKKKKRKKKKKKVIRAKVQSWTKKNILKQQISEIARERVFEMKMSKPVSYITVRRAEEL